MTFFESGGAGPGPHPIDSPFVALRVRRRRRATEAGSLIVSVAAGVLGVVIAVIGPANIVAAMRPAPPEVTAEIVAVADKAFLTEQGRELLQASRAQVASREKVAEVCQRSPDDPPSGCWDPLSGIYVFVPGDARIADGAVTTLAHELLHAAYDQLGAGERENVDGLLEAEIARVPAEDPVHEQIAWSVGEHESSRETELFAYLGSQIRLEGGFAPELEAVYARYFTDRMALVEVAFRVDEVMTGLFAELQAVYDGVSAAETANANERAQLEVDRQAHEAARTQYNADADLYNGISGEERSRWTGTWIDAEGVNRTASFAESLERRLALIEKYRVDLDARAIALAEAEAAAVAQRAAAEARYADLMALRNEAYATDSAE